MAYTSANLNLQSQSVAGKRHWTYHDTGGAANLSEVSGFIADAKDKGMKAGDFLTYHDTNLNKIYGYAVSAVQDTGATTGTLGLGVIIGDTS